MSSYEREQAIIKDEQHTAEVLTILGGELPTGSMKSIIEKAIQVVARSVDPIAGPPEQPSDGLLYGLIQSGKTSIITVATAVAVDNGFKCVVILTSDIDLLYEQTLERIRKALRGLSVLGKKDWRDATRFDRQLRTTPFVVVCSKNGRVLNSLLNAFKSAGNAGARWLPTLIIDDEADQASLNTYTSKGSEQVSKVNEVITAFRDYFPVNTYLQVTATPQALFLQRPDHRFRPSFTVLSEPGAGYVGGEAFFDFDSQLLEYVDLEEIELLRATNQPTPTGTVPTGLRRALFTFLVAATSRIIKRVDYNYAFLCHVSMNTRDHEHIVALIDRFKEDTSRALQVEGTQQYNNIVKELRLAFDDISKTESDLPGFDTVVDKVKFYIRGANIRLVNALTNDEIKLDAAYNIFVGGNKLGRGVTIKNLLVSYYGRNPRRPNADTVLQHARMYGYRKKDLGVTRLFLPEQLAEHFRSIHQMESALRNLVEKYPTGNFEGIYISTPLQATRRNVLDPNAIGIYVAGGNYNPAYPLRTTDMKKNTEWLDAKLKGYDGTSVGQITTVDFLIELLEKCEPDTNYGTGLWNKKTIKSALETIKSIQRTDKAYIVVRRGRKLKEQRRETRGIIAGGETQLAPADAPALFIYRQDAVGKEMDIWWPQLRFPEGNYVLAFSLNR